MVAYIHANIDSFGHVEDFVRDEQLAGLNTVIDNALAASKALPSRYRLGEILRLGSEDGERRSDEEANRNGSSLRSLRPGQ